MSTQSEKQVAPGPAATRVTHGREGSSVETLSQCHSPASQSKKVAFETGGAEVEEEAGIGGQRLQKGAPHVHLVPALRELELVAATSAEGRYNRGPNRILRDSAGASGHVTSRV